MRELLPGYLIAINFLTFVVMLIDKLQASQHARRVRERTLYLLTLVGGSPAMLLSMYAIRHKTRKISFKLAVWGVLILHLGFIIFVLN